MQISPLAARVAARHLGQQTDGAQQAQQQEQGALPKSAPGLQMVKRQLDELNRAFEKGDAEGFGKALDTLKSSHEKLAT